MLLLTSAFAMALGLGFTANGVMAEQEDHPAAPAVANELLKDAGIKARYGQGRDGGNYISDVARHMGPGTDFNGVKKTDVDAYRKAVALFLIKQGADVGEDLYKTVLKSVVYNGACDTFGVYKNSTLKLTFKDDVKKGSNLYIDFEEANGFGDVAVVDWDTDGKVLTLTVNETFNNPRPEVSDYVTELKGIIDSEDNPVLIPDGGVEITGGEKCKPTQLKSAVYSGTGSIFGSDKDDKLVLTFEDEILRAGNVHIDFKDANGFGDVAVVDWDINGKVLTLTVNETFNNPRPEVGDHVIGFSGIFGPEGRAVAPYDGIEIVEDVTATLESVVYEGICNKFGSHIDDKMTFTFSNDIKMPGNIDIQPVNLHTHHRKNFNIQENVLTVTVSEVFVNPRSLDNPVMTITGLYDSNGNQVVVPDDGVEIDVKSTGHGVLDPEASKVKFVDNGDGTGTLTTTLIDVCGNYITPDDFPVVPPNTTREEDQYPDSYRNYFRANADSKDSDHFYYIGASHFPASEGFTRALHIGGGVYTHTITKPCGYEDTWEIGIGPWLFRDDVYVVENEVEIKIAGSSCLESVVYEGTCDKFGSHIDDTLTFTFSSSIHQDGTIEINPGDDTLNLSSTFSEDVLTFEITDNQIIFTNNSVFNRHRGLSELVTAINGLVDSDDNPVEVPSDGVEIDVTSTGTGIVNADKSSATQKPIEDYKNEMTATVLDCCGHPIEDLTMDDIKFRHIREGWDTEKTLKEYHEDDDAWEILNFQEANGAYSWSMKRLTSPNIWHTWSLSILCPVEDEWVIIHEGTGFEIKSE